MHSTHTYMCTYICKSYWFYFSGEPQINTATFKHSAGPPVNIEPSQVSWKWEQLFVFSQMRKMGVQRA